MTLTDLYADCRKGGEDAQAAFAVLEAQHWFCSLADFDPRSGDPLPRAMNRVLTEISEGKTDRTGPPRDRLWRICEHCGMALQSLYRTTNEEPSRVHELLHVRSVRELDVQSFVKLSMRPGNNIRQKLAGNPHLDAVRHTMTLDLPENRLLKACSEELEHRLDAKEASVGLTSEEADLLDKIKSWLHTDEAASISRWTDLPPNNTLLSHRDYRRVWDAWRQLGRLDKEVSDDCARMHEIGKGIRFWSRMATIRGIEGIGMAEIPLLFDSNELSIVPFGDESAPRKIPVVFMDSDDHFPVQGELPSYGDPLSGFAQKNSSSSVQRSVSPISKIKEAVCFDFSSALPVYSSDGSSANTLRHFLAWQRWSIPNGNLSADVGCFEADGAWKRHGVETIVPLDAFFQDQDRHKRETLDIAFRTMVGFLKRKYFYSESFVWLVPDFLDEFTLGLPRRAVNASFSAAEPLPRSIAAVLAQIPYDSPDLAAGYSVIVIDQVGGVVYATKVVADYDEELAASVPETRGIRWTRHPSVVLQDEREKRGFDPDLPIVDEAGTWTIAKAENPIIPPDLLEKAEECLGRCSKRIFATRPRSPLVCGGLRVHALQRTAGELAIWRDQLPALMIPGIPIEEEGMYSDFFLVNPSINSTIRPIRNKPVQIEIKEPFSLPDKRGTCVFPLRSGSERQALDYVAIINYPVQPKPTKCSLHLSYTYGADKPFSLYFSPLEPGSSLPRKIHVEWKRSDQIKAFVPTVFDSPIFPPNKSRDELKEFPRKNGEGHINLFNWVSSTLSLLDPQKRIYGTVVDDPQEGKNGFFFFVHTDRGKKYCNEFGLRHRRDLGAIKQGTSVWLSLMVAPDKKTGKQHEFVNDIALDNSVSAEICRKRLNRIRFPMLTIMQGARPIDSPEFPPAFIKRLRRTEEILEDVLASESTSRAYKFEILQFYSYFHAFAPESFQQWAVHAVDGAVPLADCWRVIAYCLGSSSASWQKHILKVVLRLITNESTKDALFAIDILGIAAWRSETFLEEFTNDELCTIVQTLYQVMEKGQRRLSCALTSFQSLPKDASQKKRYFSGHDLMVEREHFVCSVELLLALLRIRSGTCERIVSNLRPGSEQSRSFVELIDGWTHFLHEKNETEKLRFRVNIKANMPEPLRNKLRNTPPILYALRCYLTGDVGDNSITITSIDEGEEGADSDDA